MTPKELREQRPAVYARMKEFRELANDEKHDWTEENETNWKAVNAEWDDLTRQIAEAERTTGINDRMDQLEDELSKPVNGNRGIGRPDMDGADGSIPGGTTSPADAERDSALAFGAFFRSGTFKLRDDEVDACQRLGVDPGVKFCDFALPDAARANKAARIYRSCHPADVERRIDDLYARTEQRALSTAFGSTAGYLVNQSFSSTLEMNRLAFSGMDQVGESINTPTGEPFHWPTFDDTSNTGELLGENVTSDGSTEPTVGLETWNAWAYHAKMLKVSWAMLEDAAFNLPSIIGEALGVRLGRISNTHFTTGIGTSQPKGITVGLTTGKTTVASTAIAADEILDLIHSIDIAYRTGARFMFSDEVLLVLRKLKDGTGQYLWQPGMVGGAPDVIFTHPYTINTDMSATITSGDITMVFGDLNAYKIRRAGAVRVVRLDERFAEFGQVAFDVHIRQDGRLLDAGTAPVKSMVQV